MSAAILEVRALKAFYGSAEVLHGVDFEVEPGGVTALLGANGAGKTTILRAVSAMVRREGEILFRGAPLGARTTEDIARLGVAHVPDGRGTFVVIAHPLERLPTGAPSNWRLTHVATSTEQRSWC